MGTEYVARETLPTKSSRYVPNPTQKIILILRDSGNGEEVVPRILTTKY